MKRSLVTLRTNGTREDVVVDGKVVASNKPSYRRNYSTAIVLGTLSRFFGYDFWREEGEWDGKTWKPKRERSER